MYHAFTVCTTRARGKRSWGSGRACVYPSERMSDRCKASAPPHAPEGVPPRAESHAEHPGVTGQPVVTPGQSTDMDTGAPGAKESRNAEAANIAERGTPPKKSQLGAREQEQPDVTGQAGVTQGGRVMRQMTLGEWTEGVQDSEEPRTARPAKGAHAAARRTKAKGRSMSGTPSSDGSPSQSYESEAESIAVS